MEREKKEEGTVFLLISPQKSESLLLYSIFHRGTKAALNQGEGN